MNKTVKVYTLPRCVNCNQTKAALRKRGIAYEEVPLASNPKLVEGFKAQGFKSAPIVTYGDHIWSGYDERKIEEIANEINPS